MITTYPNIDIKDVFIKEGRKLCQQYYFIELATIVRIQDTDGKWYKTLFRKNSKVSALTVTTERQRNLWKNQIFQNFISEIHFAHHCFIVNSNIRLQDGTVLFELDENQESEKDRLIKNRI